MTGMMRDPRSSRGREFGPAFGMGGRGRPTRGARRRSPGGLPGSPSTWLLVLVVVAFFVSVLDATTTSKNMTHATITSILICCCVIWSIEFIMVSRCLAFGCFIMRNTSKQNQFFF